MARSSERQQIRLVLPMLTYVPGGMGGSETYVRNLVGELTRRDDVVVSTIVSRSAAGAIDPEVETVARHVRGGSSTLGRLTTVARGLAPVTEHHGVVRSADVVHYPFSVPVPRPPRRKPHVVTLLDVQHRDLPGMFSPAERAWRGLTYDRPARRADLVITISDFCRQRIVHHLGIPPERVRVAHLGVDMHDFAPHHGPRQPFVLYPARGWPHKNHATLVAAMELVRAERPDVTLVLTGGGAPHAADLPRWVDHRGQVSEADLRDLYRQAACLAFPSLYEGFGLPPLEAMASGCPVAASREGSLPEVCGDAADLFDARDPHSIKDGILAAMDAGPRRREAALARAARFSWAATADAHVEAYRSVLGRT